MCMAPGKIKFKTRRQDIATVTWPRIRKRKFALDTQSRKKPFVDLSCKPEGVKTSPPLQGWKSGNRALFAGISKLRAKVVCSPFETAKGAMRTASSPFLSNTDRRAHRDYYGTGRYTLSEGAGINSISKCSSKGEPDALYGYFSVTVLHIQEGFIPSFDTSDTDWLTPNQAQCRA